MNKIIFAVIILVLLPHLVLAADNGSNGTKDAPKEAVKDLPKLKGYTWDVTRPAMTSAELAISGKWTLVSSDALPWHDDKSLLVTYWHDGANYLRCVDQMSGTISIIYTTNSVCFRPVLNK